MLTGYHLQTRDCSSLGGEASLHHVYRNVHHIKAANPQWHHKMIAWTAKFFLYHWLVWIHLLLSRYLLKGFLVICFTSIFIKRGLSLSQTRRLTVKPWMLKLKHRQQNHHFHLWEYSRSRVSAAHSAQTISPLSEAAQIGFIAACRQNTIIVIVNWSRKLWEIPSAWPAFTGKPKHKANNLCVIRGTFPPLKLMWWQR